MQAQAAFAATIALIFLPSLLFVYGVMADVEQIFFKSHGLISHEAPHLARIGRPVAALFGNMPLYFLEELSDFRFARVFSLLTVIGVGCVIIRVLVRHLWVSPGVAMVIALGMLCLPGFIFSIMNPTAWPMHLLSLVLAVAAYALYSRSHAGSFFLLEKVRAVDVAAIRQIYFSADRRPGVVAALSLLVFSLFTYPPNTLLILAFPVAVVLFSPLPAPVRASLFLRDLGFVAISIAAFILVSKLLYFPIGRFMSLLDAVPDEGANSIYRFVFDFNAREILARLLECLRISKDLWFLPNFSDYVLGGYVLLGGALIVLWAIRRQPIRLSAGVAALVGIAVCFVLSVSPLLFSLGGVISYRTLLAPTAIVMLLVIYAMWRLHVLVPHSNSDTWLRRDGIFQVPLVATIFLTTSYSICAVIQICQNELAHMAWMVQHAVDERTEGLLLVDDRENMQPDEIKVAQDRKGHALLPYESACFSTYCYYAPGMYAAAKYEIGIPPGAFEVGILRGKELKGATCDMILSNPAVYADLRGWTTVDSTQLILHDFMRRNPIMECRPYDASWLDLERRYDSSILKSPGRIDQSIWKVFLPGRA